MTREPNTGNDRDIALIRHRERSARYESDKWLAKPPPGSKVREKPVPTPRKFGPATPKPESQDTRLSATIVARRCACKGWITAPENVGAVTVETVQQHQLEEPHKSWDRKAWIDANSVRGDVRVIVRRVA